MRNPVSMIADDERVTEENVRRGVAMTLQILERVAATRSISEEEYR